MDVAGARTFAKPLSQADVGPKLYPQGRFAEAENRFQLRECLGAGTFGVNSVQEYSSLTIERVGSDVHTGEEVATKLEQ